MTWPTIVDPANPFEENGISDEDRAALDFVAAAKADGRGDFYVTSTIDHPNTGTTRHLKPGTNGRGLAVDSKVGKGPSSKPGAHRAIYLLWREHVHELHELIYFGEQCFKDGKPFTYPDSVMVGHKNHVHSSWDLGTFLHYTPSAASDFPFDPMEQFPMSIYKDQRDAEELFVRRAYLDLLLREPESQQVVDDWINALHQNGADAVWSVIADSGEGQAVFKAKRKLLGI